MSSRAAFHTCAILGRVYRALQSLPAVIIAGTWAPSLYLAVNEHCLLSRRGPGVSDRPPQCEVAAGASSPSLIVCTWGGRTRCNCDKRRKKKLCSAGFSTLIYNLQIDYSFSASRANCLTLSPRLETVLDIVALCWCRYRRTFISAV